LGFASTGIAVVMLVHLIRMKVRGRLADEEHVATFLDSMRVVRNTLVAVLVLQLGTFFFWWLSLRFGSLHDQEALAAANHSYGPMFWWLGIGIGLVVPLALGGFVVVLGEASHRRLQCTMIGVTSALILAGGFFFRLAVVLAGQSELPVHILS
jgi:formate-dependent nitrite reductase membrane component NrfD